MKHQNDDAMGMGEITFAVFCVIAVLTGVIYIIAVANSNPQITDTFGETIAPNASASQDIVVSIQNTGASAIVPLILIVGIIALCAVIFLLWTASKNWGSGR